jgi:hypothetical protein
MRFLLDENADARLVSYLTDQGHDVTQIATDYPSGLPDEQVLSLAHQEGRILITNDKDFGEWGLARSGTRSDRARARSARPRDAAEIPAHQCTAHSLPETA